MFEWIQWFCFKIMYLYWFIWKLEFYFWFLWWYFYFFTLIKHFIPFKYQKKKKKWIDINECLTNNGGCDVNAICANTIGSFNCQCHSGYSGDGITCTGITFFIFNIWEKGIQNKIK